LIPSPVEAKRFKLLDKIGLLCAPRVLINIRVDDILAQRCGAALQENNSQEQDRKILHEEPSGYCLLSSRVNTVVATSLARCDSKSASVPAPGTGNLKRERYSRCWFSQSA